MITATDTLELIKIIIIMIIGYILVKALLLGTGDIETSKCVCDCINKSGIIHLK